jgi:Tol biopolymer transport system component
MIAPLLLLALQFAPLEPPTPVVLLEQEGVENAYPRLSSDGKRVLFQSNRGGKWQIVLLDLASTEEQVLTTGDSNDNFPDWSADGAWIAFVSDRDGNEEIYRMRSDGTGLERLTEDPARDIHPYFSPDGKSLLLNSTRGNGSLDVYRLDLESRELARITDSTAEETCARYAPDMQRIVLLRNDAVSDDVMLLDPATGRMENLTRTPSVRDGWPVFSRDGRWIYYSTMRSGSHCIHRMRPDGTEDEALTAAAPGEEDARASLSADGSTLVFNKRRGRTIAILSLRTGSPTTRPA